LNAPVQVVISKLLLSPQRIGLGEDIAGGIVRPGGDAP
jgi:hypothetical protein